MSEVIKDWMPKMSYPRPKGGGANGTDIFRQVIKELGGRKKIKTDEQADKYRMEYHQRIQKIYDDVPKTWQQVPFLIKVTERNACCILEGSPSYDNGNFRVASNKAIIRMVENFSDGTRKDNQNRNIAKRIKTESEEIDDDNISVLSWEHVTQEEVSEVLAPRYIPEDKSTTTKAIKEERGLQIKKLASVEECKDYFDIVVQSHLNELRTAQNLYLEHWNYFGEASNVWFIKAKWAELWARGMALDQPDAKPYEYDRWIVKKLLDRVCDLCYVKVHKGSCQGVLKSKDDLIHAFGIRRILSILDVIVVMERANSLFNMMDDSIHRRGFHWYSQWHEEEGLLKFEARNNSGPSINKRLLWLYYTKELGLQENQSLKYWLCPVMSPLHFTGDEALVYLSLGMNIEEGSLPQCVTKWPLVSTEGN